MPRARGAYRGAPDGVGDALTWPEPSDEGRARLGSRVEWRRDLSTTFREGELAKLVRGDDREDWTWGVSEAGASYVFPTSLGPLARQAGVDPEDTPGHTLLSVRDLAQQRHPAMQTSAPHHTVAPPPPAPIEGGNDTINESAAPPPPPSRADAAGKAADTTGRAAKRPQPRRKRPATPAAAAATTAPSARHGGGDGVGVLDSNMDSRELPDTTSAKLAGRPVFHAYGRANASPSVGGVLYGNYMLSHAVWPQVPPNLPKTKQVFPGVERAVSARGRGHRLAAGGGASLLQEVPFDPSINYSILHEGDLALASPPARLSPQRQRRQQPHTPPPPPGAQTPRSRATQRPTAAAARLGPARSAITPSNLRHPLGPDAAAAPRQGPGPVSPSRAAQGATRMLASSGEAGPPGGGRKPEGGPGGAVAAVAAAAAARDVGGAAAPGEKKDGGDTAAARTASARRGDGEEEEEVVVVAEEEKQEEGTGAHDGAAAVALAPAERWSCDPRLVNDPRNYRLLPRGWAGQLIAPAGKVGPRGGEHVPDCLDWRPARGLGRLGR